MDLKTKSNKEMSNQPKYNQAPINTIKIENKEVACFQIGDKNLDKASVESFGEEWTKFNSFSQAEIEKTGDEYFDIINSNIVNENSTILDVGCGTGRWSIYWADRVKFIEAIDPSLAVISAAKITQNIPNIRITKASADNIPFDDQTFDLVMSIGVLHHIPNTALALKQITEKAKLGGYVYVYLYYALDNRGIMYKSLFKISNLIRFFISKMPTPLKKLICDLIATFIYLFFVSLSLLLKFLFPNSKAWKKIPLSYYTNKSFNIIRNDALDRFGTPLEQRFSKQEILEMMQSAGLKDIIISPNTPYWHVLGRK
jgi:ubiquinone/menaquinone biosynthesis C-methylase UbiE